MKQITIEKAEFKGEATSERADKKVPYEAPKAVFVDINLTERLMNCGQWSEYVCGINAAYQ